MATWIKNMAKALTGGSSSAQESTGNIGLEQMLSEREQWLNDKFGRYSGAVQNASGQYGGLLDSLISRLSSPSSEVSFGMAGGPQVGFIPRQTRDLIAQLAGLGESRMTNALTPAMTDWTWQQQNPLYSGATQFLDYLGGAANQSEARRYGTQSSTQTGSLNSNASPLTTIGVIGNLTNNALDIYDKWNTLNNNGGGNDWGSINSNYAWPSTWGG